MIMAIKLTRTHHILRGVEKLVHGDEKHGCLTCHISHNTFQWVLHVQYRCKVAKQVCKDMHELGISYFLSIVYLQVKPRYHIDILRHEKKIVSNPTWVTTRESVGSVQRAQPPCGSVYRYISVKFIPKKKVWANASVCSWMKRWDRLTRKGAHGILEDIQSWQYCQGVKVDC